MITDSSSGGLGIRLGYPKREINLYQAGRSGMSDQFIKDFCKLLDIDERVFFEIESQASLNHYTYQEILRIVLKRFDDIEISIEANSITSKCLRATRMVAGYDEPMFARKCKISQQTINKVEGGVEGISQKTVQIYANSIGMTSFDLLDFIEWAKENEPSDREIISNLTNISVKLHKLVAN